MAEKKSAFPKISGRSTKPVIRIEGMPGKPKTVAMTATQELQADGSILVKPVAVVADRDIGTKEAAKILGLHPQTISNLCSFGQTHGGLKAWKMPSQRNNAKWRISLQSVYSYRDGLQTDSIE